MSWSKRIRTFAGLAPAVMMLAVCAGAARADGNEKLLIPVGHAQVVIADDAVKTVAIAEPKIADAAVGSERTVVVNGKTVGSTSLVVYGEGGRFHVYDIEVYKPNSDKQVSLHVRVAEINEQAKKELGFDFAGGTLLRVPGHTDFLSGGVFTTKVSDPHNPLIIGPETDGALSYDRDKGNTAAQTTWRALEEHGDIRVLANPTLVAASGQKATFHAGGEFPVPIASSGGTNFITVTIEWKPFGVKVEFTPTVEDDGSILLNVAPEVSQLDFTNPLTLSGFVIPILVTRKTSTTVHLNPGEHLVIGGLKQTEKNKVVRKVPVLGDIPLLGFFFTNTKTESTERDLLVVVSPEMVEGGSTTLPRLPTDAPPMR
jgi:pilus assembly protein CpaC